MDNIGLRVHRFRSGVRITIHHRRLLEFKNDYNRERVHQKLNGALPEPKDQSADASVACLENHRWKKHCRDLNQLPKAA